MAVVSHLFNGHVVEPHDFYLLPPGDPTESLNHLGVRPSQLNGLIAGHG